MTTETAEIIAVQALEWLVANEDLLKIFVDATGSTGESLKVGMDDPALLLSVLDFILMDDQWVIDFCKSIGLDPFKLQSVRGFLPTGNEIYWT